MESDPRMVEAVRLFQAAEAERQAWCNAKKCGGPEYTKLLRAVRAAKRAVLEVQLFVSIEATDRYRWEKPAMKIVEDVKTHLLPAMDEEEGGWLLGKILDLTDQVASLEAPGAEARQDLIHRLESRAMIEAPQDNDGYDPDSDSDDSAEITWGELAEIAALMREAAQALKGSALSRPASGWQPIETAPKDGTRVLGGWVDYPLVQIVFCDRDETWRESQAMRSSAPPDHWMPLPAPPASGQEEPNKT